MDAFLVLGISQWIEFPRIVVWFALLHLRLSAMSTLPYYDV
jgi:hypothetical protein